MKRWIGISLLLFTVLSTGCVDRYRYRNDYRYRYDRGRNDQDYRRYDHRTNDNDYRR